jgi:hypothetical protein
LTPHGQQYHRILGCLVTRLRSGHTVPQDFGHDDEILAV